MSKPTVKEIMLITLRQLDIEVVEERLLVDAWRLVLSKDGRNVTMIVTNSELNNDDKEHIIGLVDAKTRAAKQELEGGSIPRRSSG